VSDNKDYTQSMHKSLRGGIVNKMTSFSSSSSSSLSSSIPNVLYGTAWKKERTAELVELAIRTGFRGIDTACQPRHYNEAGVGEAVLKLINEGIVKRSDLFLQTKYTPIGGQDPNNIPYDPKEPIATQVQQSFAKSLSNLHTDYLDSLVLHSPLAKLSDTLIVWQQFEEIYKRNGVKRLGISNCYDLDLFKKIFDSAEIKPSFLQNRFYKDSDYDVELRRYCRENNIVYQSFWTLTANPHIIKNKVVQNISAKLGKTPEQVFFAFVRSMGILFLSGTKDRNHMMQDLEVENIKLEQQDIDSISTLL
jgi:diketogulonate reductase-like aldo/keto reductase